MKPGVILAYIADLRKLGVMQFKCRFFEVVLLPQAQRKRREPKKRKVGFQ